MLQHEQREGDAIMHGVRHDKNKLPHMVRTIFQWDFMIT